MGAAGLVGLGGGAPVPEAERVAAIRFTILDDADACAAFAEPQRAALADMNTRSAQALEPGGHADCRAQLARLQATLDALDTTRLEPRAGLAGLFDGRVKRLKAFRAAYASAVPMALDTVAEIAQRGRAIAGRNQTLDDLWTQIRDAVTDLDAHIVAAHAWLADRNAAAPAATESQPSVTEPALHAGQPASDPYPDTSGHPGGAEATAEAATPTQASLPDAGPIAHALQKRLTDLVAVRSLAVATLPLIRAAQNANHRLPATLKGLPDAIEAWRLEWRDCLGMAGKKPRKVRPDRDRLETAGQVVIDIIAAADGELNASLTRWAELDKRVPRSNLLATAEAPRVASQSAR